MLAFSHRLAAASRPLAAVLRSSGVHARAASTAAPSEDPVTISVTSDGIAVVKFDAPGEKVNTLSAKLMKSFDAVMTKLETDPAIRAAVLISGKSDNFIAGADIAMLVCDTWQRFWRVSARIEPAANLGSCSLCGFTCRWSWAVE